MPGAPPPPPGLPALPVPPDPLLPKELFPLPADGDKDGLGEYVPLPVPDEAPVPPLPTPVGAEVPPIGPVESVLPVGALVGLGTLNGVEGFTGAGAEVGADEGLAVGGAGFAGDGLFTAED